MRRLTTMLAITLLLPGCSGSSWTDTPGQGGRPPTSEPVLGGIGGPPPAHLEAATGGVEMAQGSGCWSSVDASGGGVGRCIDTVSWSARHDIPRLVAGQGETITLRLGFVPTEPIDVQFAGRHFTLPAQRSSTLAVHGHGLLTILARAANGDASYAARI
jgi:hypothetical protein